MASRDSHLRPQLPFAPGLRRQYGGRTVYPVDLPPAPMPGSVPGALTPEGGLKIRLPGANYSPAGSIPFDLIGDGNIAPSSSAVLVTFTVPDTLRSRIAGIGFGADDEVALGSLTWTLALNGDPSPGYPNQAAAIGSIVQLSDVFVLAYASNTVTVVANTNATLGGTFRFICRVRGWHFTEDNL